MLRDGANAPPQHERIKPVLLSICQQKLKANWKLYARNPNSTSLQGRLGAVHKAQHVGNRDAFSAQNLDVFTLSHLYQKLHLHSRMSIVTIYFY